MVIGHSIGCGAAPHLAVRHPDAFVVYAPEFSANLNWTGLLAQVTCPVLLIHTDPESGGILSPGAAAAFRQHVPQAQLPHIPGATHSIRRDRFGEYMAAVAQFLAESS